MNQNLPTTSLAAPTSSHIPTSSHMSTSSHLPKLPNFPELTGITPGMPPPAAIPPAFPNYSQPTSLSGLSLPMSGSIGTSLTGIPQSNFQAFQPTGQDYRHAQNFQHNGTNFQQNIGNGVAGHQSLPQHHYLDPQMPNLIPSDLQPKFEFAPPNKNISEISALQGHVSTSKPQSMHSYIQPIQTQSNIPLIQQLRPQNTGGAMSSINLQPNQMPMQNLQPIRNQQIQPLQPKTSVILETSSGKRKRSYQHIHDPAERRRVRNRESAKQARQNKKNYIVQLEENERGLQEKNQALKAENDDIFLKMKQLVEASDIKEEAVESIIGSSYFERISEGVVEGVQATGERGSSDGYNGEVDRNYNYDEPKKENYSTVHVKQELIDGRTSSLETYGSDVHSVVTINREIEGQHGVPVPATITACVKNGIRSPSTSSGYTSEGQPIINPVNSPMEIPTVSAIPYNHQQLHHNQVNTQVPNRAPNQQLNTHQQQNNSNFNPHFGTFTPNNMFNYDSQMIQNARMAMMSQPQVGNSNDELAQPDQLISIEENGQKAQIIEYDNNNLIENQVEPHQGQVLANNLVDQAMFMSGINN